jgi:hypothetical protein
MSSCTATLVVRGDNVLSVVGDATYTDGVFSDTTIPEAEVELLTFLVSATPLGGLDALPPPFMIYRLDYNY